MRLIVILTCSAFLISSCSSSNRIFENQDDFKEQSTIKLNQPLKGYSDELRRGLISAPYTITFKHFYSTQADGEKTYCLDVNLETLVRAYEIEPVLFISIGKKKIRLESEELVTKMFQSGSSSSTSDTNSTTKVDPDNEDEEITETTTSYTTSSSHDTYQLMHMRLHPDISLMKEIRNSSEVRFKIYIANEGIEIPFSWRYKHKYNRYIDLIEK